METSRCPADSTRLLLTSTQPLLYTMGSPECARIRVEANAVERNAQEYSPGGATKPSPALQRWFEARECPPMMMMSRGAAQQISIRDLKSIDDLSQLKAVEKEVWGMADEDTLPLTLAIACKAAGNIFVGAFDKDKDKDKLVGFAFGFLGREHGQTTIHSHMLAVLDAYRHLDLGSRLKQAQRERAMAMGVREMTWTYDPLQSRNAHFNFSKLGVVSDTYKVGFLRARKLPACCIETEPTGCGCGGY